MRINLKSILLIICFLVLTVPVRANSLKAQEAELDKIYQALSEELSTPGKTKLDQAKEAWLTFRQEQCAFNAAGSMGGSVYPAILSLCYEELTQQYTALLKAQLNCQEGDLSCGGQ